MKEKIKKNYKKFLCLFLPLFIALIICDIISKILINKNLELGQKTDFIPGLIDLINVHNDGAAWSLFSGAQIFLIIFTIVFLLVFIYFYIQESDNGLLFHISSSLICVGCIGNLIDRICFGYVRDMLHFVFWNDFPVFNVADMCICIGVFLLCLFYCIKLIKNRQGVEK